MPLVALCPRHFLADFIICTCEFDFRQAQVSALDVSVQAEVLELFEEIRVRLRPAMLFITHDLRVAAQICDRVAIMRYGEIVEEGPTSAIFAAPRHAYTQELLAAVPGAAQLARGHAVGLANSLGA